ncbi:Cytochrome P450 [Vigna unguiculata]|uniref:Cytochrome P450 n=1 Tax=Vigna unguiculata TaxID=3917 RepID=A0A4D6M3G2_VIGUN|nr:Cytochrome P450 [Vigna unguiculata]
MAFLLVGYAAATIAALFCIYLRRCCTHPIFTEYPFVGMLPQVLCNLWRAHDYSTQVLKQHGGTGEFTGPWFTSMNYMLTCDPFNVHHMLSRNFHNYVKGPEFREIFQAFGDGIFTADAEAWKYDRDLFHSLFKHKSFEVFLEKTIQKKVKNSLLPLLNHHAQGRVVVDLQDVFNRFTFDNICSTVLGRDPECLSIDFPEVAIEKAFNQAEECIFYRHIVPKFVWKMQQWLQIGQEKKMTEACKTLDEFIYSCIASKREDLRRYEENENEETYVDLLTSLMREEEIWGKDCMELKPERWISEKGGNVYVPSYKFIAFNAGPRSCLGKDLSFIQLKMVAAAILRRYHVEVVEGYVATPSLSIVLLMKDGLKVNIRKRKF